MRPTFLKSVVFVFFVFLASNPGAFAQEGGNSSNARTLETGLIGYWPLDANSTDWTTNITKDLSGNGNDATMVGVPTATSPVPGKVAGVLNAYNGTLGTITPSCFVIGYNCYQGGIFFYSGNLSEVRIYNRALSREEVAQLYSMGQSGASPSTPASYLSSFHECEKGTGESCYTWTFPGVKMGRGESQTIIGDGRGNGAIEKITIESLDSKALRFTRADPSGRSAGLTAIYTGALRGNRFEGNVTWTWNGQTSEGTWWATPLTAANEPAPASAPPPKAESGANDAKAVYDGLACPIPPSTRDPSAANSLPLLAGDWIGQFGVPGRPGQYEPQRVHIYQDGSRVVAVKQTGNSFISTGKITFCGNYQASTFDIKVQIADRNYANPRWGDAQVTVVNANNLRFDNSQTYKRFIPPPTTTVSAPSAGEVVMGAIVVGIFVCAVTNCLSSSSNHNCPGDCEWGLQVCLSDRPNDIGNFCRSAYSECKRNC